MERVGNAYRVTDKVNIPDLKKRLQRRIDMIIETAKNLWDAAGFLGMTVQQLEETYGHHHPDFQREAVEALGG